MTACGNKHQTPEGLWVCSRNRERNIKPFHEGPHHGTGGPDGVLITWDSVIGE